MIYTKKEVTIETDAILALSTMAPTENILLFDIETTGFSRSKDTLVSITAAELLMNHAIIHQWFAESPLDEVQILNDFNALQASKPYHVTYNGHSFDIPFLYCKYQYYNIFTTLNKCKSCDLYRVSKRVLSLESYKLKHIEKALGIDREDTISGKECIALYEEYLKIGKPENAQLILQHNFEDVLNLIYVARVLSYLSDDQQLLLLPFKWSDKSIDWYLNNMTLKPQMLSVNLLGFEQALNTRLLTSKQLYLSNGDTLILQSMEQGYGITIEVQLIEQAIEGSQYLFFNNDDLGLASTLDINHSLESLLCSYDAHLNNPAIKLLLDASIRYLTG